MQPHVPMTFAELLRVKLENLQRDRENHEKLKRQIQESHEGVATVKCHESAVGGAGNSGGAVAPIDASALRVALREQCALGEDNDQAILDEHVSRVWSDPTPLLSPELASPRPHSPDGARGDRHAASQVGGNCPPAQHNYMRQLKQRKDCNHVVSTFSVDSGNIQDFTEGSELLGACSMSSLGSHIPKSKSMPSDHADSLYKQDLYLQGKFYLIIVFFFAFKILFRIFKLLLLFCNSNVSISWITQPIVMKFDMEVKPKCPFLQYSFCCN